MLDQFKEVWAFDFEFHAPDGERPQVITLGAKELRSGRTLGLDHRQLGAAPPYDVGPDNIFVSYYASAEAGCHLALGWPVPVNMLDLFTEFRNLTNCSDKQKPAHGNGLLGAMAHFGLDHMAATEKEDLRAIAIPGWPFTDDELRALVDYALEDVQALERLLPAMLPRISLGHALSLG